jgi:DNA-binding XRE family transcriptional regulator
MTDETVNPWPKVLKALRRRLRITQVEAAKEFRVPARTWIAWENGQYKPRPRTQTHLEKFFELVLPVCKD